ncbi:MAG: glycosyltransferase family 2 protein [Euryarchaeota archaeon]|nr:glycosyltransferase family 2 protein [Euryarchaeota archaeon]
MGRSSTPLGVIVLTQDEERLLPACLHSLEGLECDVFVVDSGSRDSTVALAEKAGASVVSHPFENYAAQRNWAQDNVALENPWLLHLDADERLTPQLVEEINSILEKPRAETAAYLLCKRTIFMGRWIRHGGHYPSFHLRLYKRGAGRCEDRGYDQHFVVDGDVGRLKNDYVDVLTSDIDRFVARHLRWATLEADEYRARADQPRTVQARASGTPVERKRWLRSRLYDRAPLFLRAFLYWFYRYFLRLGFVDGREGLIFHFMQGLWFRFMVDVKIWQSRRRIGRSTAD